MTRLLLVLLCACLGAAGTAQDIAPTPMIRIGVLRDGSYQVERVPVELYVARVLTGEALPGSAPAAMEALAIAIRTYAIGNMGRHRADGFDLCDQTHCQVMRTATPVTERAALATAEQVVLYQGKPAEVFYSASCGGRTEKPSNVWPGARNLPYLISQPDEGCGGVPAWSTELSAGDLQRALRAAGFSGTLRNLRIASTNESGRNATLALEGLTPGVISGQDLRAAIGRTLGWQYLQSTTFELRRSGSAYRFTGHGAGHGVGMCVIGSTKLATRGWSAERILTYYFPGTQIGRLGPRMSVPTPEPPSIGAPEPPTIRAPESTRAPAAPEESTDVLLHLPDGDEGEYAGLETMVRRERDDLVATLGVSAPPSVTVRFHPTTDAFQQRTGSPWFTLGAVDSGGMHFVPLATLRQRGVLERTIRHQWVHLLTDALLGGKPAWVREGLAIHFSEGITAPPMRAVCPRDPDLLQPVSLGALADAYANARACVERQLSAGRPWRDVR